MAVPPDFPCTDTCPLFASEECDGHNLEICRSLGFLYEIYTEYE